MAHFVATDFHGNYNIWEQIKQMITEDDTLIFLGDAIDRGDRGWEIMVELLNDPRVTYLKGNHEDLMYWSYKAPEKYLKSYRESWIKNGGGTTLNQIIGFNISQETLDFYLEKINNLPTSAAYTNDKGKTFMLTHAGFNPDDLYLNLDEYDQDFNNIWDRRHIFREWPSDWDHYYIIHGHTPIAMCNQARAFIDDIISEVPFIYANGHKINIDAGTYDTNAAIVYNLDTETATIIKGE